MGAAYFYHLTRHPLEETLSVLLTKARQAGWRIEVRGTDPARMAWLDERLWLGREDAFLPHGLSGGAHDADQPVLLTSHPLTDQAINCLMSIDGAELQPDEITRLDRACVLFDGNQQSSLEKARSQWKLLTEAGCSAQYWSEESGRWEKKAER